MVFTDDLAINEMVLFDFQPEVRKFFGRRKRIAVVESPFAGFVSIGVEQFVKLVGSVELVELLTQK